MAPRKLPKLLSKTKIMRGYQCLKNIYLTIHHPQLEAPITADQQARFDQGNEVGVEARSRFPGGVLVDNLPWDFGGSLKRTRELLAQKTEVIFEAAFEYNGCYARADVITYSKDTQRWQIYEVKSSTKLKPEHIDDVGLQAWILAKSGLPIEKIHVMYLNSECRYPNLQNLFVTEDLTDRIRQAYPDILPRVSQIFTAIKGEEVPDVDIGPQCTSPYDCGFKEYCWKQHKVPEFSLLDMPGLRDKKWELYKQGIIQVTDSRFSDATALQQRIIQAEASGQRYVDATGICSELQNWKFPLVFLDFESINSAIPQYVGQSPYMHIPFQFSVDVLEHWEGPLKHHEYLHTDASDPRPELIPQLLAACGTEGSIVAYYAQFESSRIREMADVFPEKAEMLLALNERMVDPLPILREHVYDVAFKGSFSLKAVAPALLGASQSYQGMTVADGSAAQRAFLELVNPQTAPDRKEELRQAMLEYCGKDTAVMVDLVRWLYSNCAK